MKLKIIFPLILIILFAGKPLFGEERWPIDGANNVGNVYGDWNVGSDEYYIPYIHDGIDIYAPAGTPVKCVRGGTFYYFTGDYGESRAVIEVTQSDNSVVYDVYGHTNKVVALHDGDIVQVGDTIATVMQNSTRSHVHFMICDRNDLDYSVLNVIGNPLAVISELGSYYIRYVDPTSTPYFRDLYLAHDDGGNDGNFIIAPNSITVRGKVDIVANVYDDNHGVVNGGIYKIGYNIDSNNINEAKWLIVFTPGLGPDRLVDSPDFRDAIYEAGSAILPYPILKYIVTNNNNGNGNYSGVNKSDCWDTNNLIDGDYTIYVFIKDYALNTNMKSMTVSVENTPPTLSNIGYSVNENETKLTINITTDADYVELKITDGNPSTTKGPYSSKDGNNNTISWTRNGNNWTLEYKALYVPPYTNPPTPDAYGTAHVECKDNVGNPTVSEFTFKTVPIRAAYPFIRDSDNSLYTRALAKGFEPFFTNDFTMSRFGIPDTLPIPHGNLTKTAKEWVRYGALLEGGGVNRSIQ